MEEDSVFMWSVDRLGFNLLAKEKEKGSWIEFRLPFPQEMKSYEECNESIHNSIDHLLEKELGPSANSDLPQRDSIQPPSSHQIDNNDNNQLEDDDQSTARTRNLAEELEDEHLDQILYGNKGGSGNNPTNPPTNK